MHMTQTGVKERHGSSKIIRAYRPGLVELEVTNCVSVFDVGPMPQMFPGLGMSRCACALQSFAVARTVGIPTHFIRPTSRTSFLAQEFAVPCTEPLSGEAVGRVLPIEVIFRFFLDGSLWRRVDRDEIDIVSLGYASDTVLKKGMILPVVLVEFTTKFEDQDRHLTDEEAQDLAELTGEEWLYLHTRVCSLAKALSDAFTLAGFQCRDGKFEVGLTWQGELVFVDVFGAQDECRIHAIDTGKVHDKDIVRDALEEEYPLWKARLGEAKRAWPNDKGKWPPYPDLSVEAIDLTRIRYREFANLYASYFLPTN
jgi:phosphoribosylaminoimidazole-succinocarboxamide synthase